MASGEKKPTERRSGFSEISSAEHEDKINSLTHRDAVCSNLEYYIIIHSRRKGNKNTAVAKKDDRTAYDIIMAQLQNRIVINGMAMVT